MKLGYFYGLLLCCLYGLCNIVILCYCFMGFGVGSALASYGRSLCPLWLKLFCLWVALRVTGFGFKVAL